jgi:hypothetical protein
LATNLVAAMPTEQVMPCSAAICSRISAAIRVGGPSRRRAPLTSRKASSTLTCSTSEVVLRSTSITRADTAR